MGEVISSEFGSLDKDAETLMNDVFAACDKTMLEPEFVCMLMITTFGNSLFAHLCQDHAEEHWFHAVGVVHLENGVE